MKVDFLDRFVASLSYLTFGIFSIIWLVFVNIVKKPVSKFLAFNLYQAIFLSVILAVISMLYSIAYSFLAAVPVIREIVKDFDIAMHNTPIYYGTTLSGFLISLLILYLIIMSLLGKKPFIPLVSDVISTNVGG